MKKEHIKVLLDCIDKEFGNKDDITVSLRQYPKERLDIHVFLEHNRFAMGYTIRHDSDSYDFCINVVEPNLSVIDISYISYSLTNVQLEMTRKIRSMNK